MYKLAVVMKAQAHAYRTKPEHRNPGRGVVTGMQEQA